jgi:hypothetical protein
MTALAKPQAAAALEGAQPLRKLYLDTLNRLSSGCIGSCWT